MSGLDPRPLLAGAALVLALSWSASAATLAASTAPPMTGAGTIQMLDQTIDWYRTLGIQQQAANEPSDLLILYDNHQTANQVIGLAFDIAKADAEILAKQPSSGAPPTVAGSQTLTQLQGKLAAQAATVQAELESDRRQLGQARAQHRTELQAKIAELQGELDLISVKKNLLGTLSSFSDQSRDTGFDAGALKAQIDAMAVTMPSAAGTAPPAANAGSGNSTAAAASGGMGAVAAARFGIWQLAANVLRLSEKVSTIDDIDRRTVALQDTFARIRAPLIDQLKQLSARGDTLATQADTADSATLNRVHDELDSLSIQFKQASALVIPLSKEAVLLDQYRRNLANWRVAIEAQTHDALKSLGVRSLVLAVLLALIFTAAEVWGRAVVRYVPDPRRRYQHLLLRKIALWSLVVVIVGFAFASELGSIVTFAGLITAGLAVAMQSVLVSIVGYFFLIGKYGIRVGDRVQIGEVTGEVIELGLVRMYLMELGGHGMFGPTGRVVAFANSIVFQVSSGLFKQIHGVNFVWREIVLNLPARIDFAAAKEKLETAMAAALKDYRDEIVRQTREIQRATSTSSGGDAQPRVQLIFSAAGVEAHIRYPVYPQNAAEIDERVSQHLLEVVSALDADSKATKDA
ncbi:MAG TPA: mechanosensitive ion channel domain-containing protein [Steroidobacteraceae bacterium]|nr:mechanosensitive ion channel domain-containing protein [Steroidobacteraceae bacterium]